MAKIETTLIQQSETKPKEWRRYIDNFQGLTLPLDHRALTQKKKANERIVPFVTTYHPAVNNLKKTLMEQLSLIQNQPFLKTIYLKTLIISYKRGKSLKDTLVRSKI